jgi:hypothetical protein
MGDHMRLNSRGSTFNNTYCIAFFPPWRTRRTIICDSINSQSCRTPTPLQRFDKGRLGVAKTDFQVPSQDGTYRDNGYRGGHNFLRLAAAEDGVR